MSNLPLPIELQDKFFSELRILYPKISKIYFPGCGDDRILNHYFGKGIVYLDCNRFEFRQDVRTIQDFRLSGYDHEMKHSLLVGDYGLPLIRDEVFDLIFFQDSHANEKEFEVILRTLKYGGIIINSDVKCPINLTIDDLLKFPELVRPNVPHFLYVNRDNFYRNYKVLQKIRK